MSSKPFSIPCLNGDGYLPEGIYSCNEELLCSHFVEPFASSSMRRSIYEGFISLRGDIKSLDEPLTQWVNGSFVTDKTNPSDIDVISFCDAEYFDGLDENSQNTVTRLLGGRNSTKKDYLSHTFLAFIAKEGHPDYDNFNQCKEHWREYWSRTYIIDPETGLRVRCDQRKGFLEMTL